MSWPRSDRPCPNNAPPTDLITIGEAAKRTGIADNTIRRWISRGKGSSKLQTYHRAEDIHVTYVSERQVSAFAAKRTRSRDHRVLGGEMGIRLQEADAASLRQLARMMSARVGVPICYTEALRGAIAHALRLEELRAKQREVPNE